MRTQHTKTSLGWLIIAATLWIPSFLGAGCGSLPTKPSVSNDDLSALARQIAQGKTWAGEGMMGEVTLGREEPEMRSTLGLDAAEVVCSAHTETGARALLYFDRLIATNHASWVGAKITVAGLMNREASQRLRMPVLRVVRCELVPAKPASAREFVPSDFNVPRLAETSRFRVRPITVRDVRPDYDAVMTSREHLRGCFGPNHGWPSDQLTLEQDLRDLSWHQLEFQKRCSFTYAVFTPDESREIGAVYLYPAHYNGSDPQKTTGFDAQVILWVRASELASGLDLELYEFTRAWLSQKWPFKKVAFPGRSIPWQDWKKVP